MLLFLFERSLSQQQIDDVTNRGIRKASHAFLTAAQLENPEAYLRDQFEGVIRCINCLLENFSPQNFTERGHHLRPNKKIKPMLLSAFEAVTFLSELENLNRPNVSPFRLNDISEWYKDRLQIAIQTYLTNGSQNLPLPELAMAA